MPTELTPAPNAFHPVHFSRSLPRSMPTLIHGPGMMPPTGPARAIDCLPAPPAGPNQCLPNGLKNPWGPYSGSVYISASTAVENMAASVREGSVIGGSVIAPRSISPYHGQMARSVIAPRSIASGFSMRSGFGMRDDDGWGGSQGRIHRGLEPDLSSTAGALPPIVTAGSAWGYHPSSPANHVRLSPQSPEVYVQPPVADSASFRPRRMSVSQMSSDQYVDCPPRVRQRSVSQSLSQADRPLPPSAGNGQGPYKRIGGSPARGSPLRPSPEQPLSRQTSRRSQRSNGSARCCSECAA